jgi:hypothetical protein
VFLCIILGVLGGIRGFFVFWWVVLGGFRRVCLFLWFFLGLLGGIGGFLSVLTVLGVRLCGHWKSRVVDLDRN